MLDNGIGATLIVFACVILAIHLSRAVGTTVILAIAGVLGLIFIITVCKGEHK